MKILLVGKPLPGGGPRDNNSGTTKPPKSPKKKNGR